MLYTRSTNIFQANTICVFCLLKNYLCKMNCSTVSAYEISSEEETVVYFKRFYYTDDILDVTFLTGRSQNVICFSIWWTDIFRSKTFFFDSRAERLTFILDYNKSFTVERFNRVDSNVWTKMKSYFYGSSWGWPSALFSQNLWWSLLTTQYLIVKVI